MENRIVKFKSKESAGLNLHAIPGHFATSHSHINYYVDVTSIKTRVSEAKEAAKALYTKVPHHSYIDTIVCMDGTEMIGAFLSQEIERNGLMSVNKHETIYVVSPEINNGQMLFRDNNKGAMASMLYFFWQLPRQVRRSEERWSVSTIMAVWSHVLRPYSQPSMRSME